MTTQSSSALVRLACAAVAAVLSPTCGSDAGSPDLRVSAVLSQVESATDTIGACRTGCAAGLDATTITVTVRDTTGLPFPGVQVRLEATPAGGTRLVDPGPSGTTDAGGAFRASLTATAPGPVTVTATAAGVRLTPATVTVVPVLVGAGDIADCGTQGDDATAVLLDSLPGAVFTTGDNAYPAGRLVDYANCYQPTWGRHRARTRPVPGNRDYDSSAIAADYFAYFGAAAGTMGEGYYSYEVGAWHIVALNSEVSMSSGGAQAEWLRRDLAGRRDQCVLAYWHRPYYSSGQAGNTSGARPLWEILADSGAEVVLWGHDHLYERFAPMDRSGAPSPTGMRAFVVGTGGGETLSNWGPIQPNSEVRDNTSRGVVRLVLYPTRYRWEFVPAPGFGSFRDAGAGTCGP